MNSAYISLLNLTPASFISSENQYRPSPMGEG